MCPSCWHKHAVTPGNPSNNIKDKIHWLEQKETVVYECKTFKLKGELWKMHSSESSKRLITSSILESLLKGRRRLDNVRTSGMEGICKHGGHHVSSAPNSLPKKITRLVYCSKLSKACPNIPFTPAIKISFINQKISNSHLFHAFKGFYHTPFLIWASYSK